MNCVHDQLNIHFTCLGDIVTTGDIEREAIEVLKRLHPGRKFYAHFGPVDILRNSFEIGYTIWWIDE